MFNDSDVPYSPFPPQTSGLYSFARRAVAFCHGNVWACNTHSANWQEFAAGDLMLKIAHVDPIVEWLPPLPPTHTGREEMRSCVVLSCLVLCCGLLCYVVVCGVALCCVARCCVAMCCVVLRSVVSCCVVSCRLVLCCAVLGLLSCCVCIVLRRVVSCCGV